MFANDDRLVIGSGGFGVCVCIDRDYLHKFVNNCVMHPATITTLRHPSPIVLCRMGRISDEQRTSTTSSVTGLRNQKLAATNL